MNFDDELMINQWNILPASKSDWKDSNVEVESGVLEDDCIMLQSSVAVVFFFLKLARASVSI